MEIHFFYLHTVRWTPGAQEQNAGYRKTVGRNIGAAALNGGMIIVYAKADLNALRQQIKVLQDYCAHTKADGVIAYVRVGRDRVV